MKGKKDKNLIQPTKKFERRIARALTKLPLVVGVLQSQYFKRTKKQSASANLTELEVSSGDFVSKANMKSLTCPMCGWNVKTHGAKMTLCTMLHKPKKDFA